MKKIIAGNWKLNLGPAQARQFFVDWKKSAVTSSHQIVFFPSAVSADATAQALAGTGIEWGLQNSWTAPSGAFTGENSVAMSKEMGAQWCLVGHSERRQFFGETDAWCADKVKAIMGAGLKPMLCIGETLEERKSGKMFDVLRTQLTKGLSQIPKASFLAIAYEPVWAIGTGVVATPEQVAEAHKFVDDVLGELGFRETPILYGGSVKPDNSEALLSIPKVSGFLVGGASLVPAQFLQIANTKG